MRPSRISAALLAGGLAFGSGCEREERRFSEPKATERVAAIAQSQLHPGDAAPPPLRRNPYADNAWAVSEGQRLFRWFNCQGCHANGGGGMGPALMDAKWIYGREPDNIFATIMEGRPNGMPSFRGRINEQQAWQLAAYVAALAGQLRKDVEPGRQDHLDKNTPPQSTENPPPSAEATPPKE